MHRLLFGRLKGGLLAGIAILVLAGGVTVGGTSAHAASASADSGSNERAVTFRAAAKEFGVPESVLLAVSYNESRWTPHGDGASSDNGYGLMDLRFKTLQPQSDKHGRGEPTHGKAITGTIPTVMPASRYTLDDAARLLGVSAAQLKTDEKANIRGGAAVLAEYARQQHGGSLPTTTADWYGAVAAYSGALTEKQAADFADGVYAQLKLGAKLTTEDGQAVSLTADPTLSPNRTSVSTLGLTATPQITEPTDCPTTISCTFTPAAYAQNSSDPTDYGNYDKANRPTDMPIKYIIIHDTEGGYSGTVSWFQNPAAYVSSHYVIRSSDGAVTEMVRPGNISWGAGDWHTNMHAINIEHEGYAEQGATWYTEAMYQSSAKLVQYLHEQYGVPLDRQHIIGHDQVPTLNGSLMSGQHWDPGPYWDWNHYMELVTGVPVTGTAVTSTTKAVTILPNFATNKPVITKCSRPKNCNEPSQGASVVYLHTSASESAPLLTDKYKHTSGSAGTTLVSDWSATATSGRTYAVAGTSTGWTAVWFGSQKGWFANPFAGTTTRPTAIAAASTAVTPRSGLASVNVYGASYPEASAYPSTITPQTLSPLYTIPAGQTYTVTDTPVTDYYYAPTINSTMPGDHTVVIGSEAYYQISYNHRVGYVKAADVTVSQL